MSDATSAADLLRAVLLYLYDHPNASVLSLEALRLPSGPEQVYEFKRAIDICQERGLITGRLVPSESALAQPYLTVEGRAQAYRLKAAAG